MSLMVPDHILHNGTVRTFAQTNDVVSAIAICGKKIVALGDEETVCGLAGSRTQIIDLNHRPVLPGFTDSHFHFYEWAMNLDSIDFAATRSLEEMYGAIEKKAAELGADTWVLGQGFNESEYPENRMPDRWDLDRIAPLIRFASGGVTSTSQSLIQKRWNAPASPKIQQNPTTMW